MPLVARARSTHVLAPPMPPPIHLVTSIIQYFVLKPNNAIAIATPVVPTSKTGFLPHRSEIALAGMTKKIVNQTGASWGQDRSYW
jgi:hypothetical protein